MKILQCVADGNPGGGTTHVLQILKRISGVHELALLTDTGSYLAAACKDMGIRVFEGRMFGSRLSSTPVNVVRNVVRDYQPDLIHAHGGRANFYVTRANSNVRVVYTVHGFHHRTKSFFARTIGALSEKYCIKKASHVIFVCQHDHDVAIKENLLNDKKTSSVIYNGIVLPDGQLNGASEWADRIGFVGRFVHQKNPELFIHVLKEIPNAVGVMVGGGELLESTMNMAKALGVSNRIEFTGVLSRDQVLKVLTTFDCMIMPSRWEGLPILPLEAMWLGIPVIASAVGGIPEILSDGENGFLFSGEDIPTICRSVHNLQIDPIIRQRIIQNAKSTVHGKFTEDVMIDKVLSVYRSLTE